MCGFAGFLRTRSSGCRANHRDYLKKMGDSIIHRGPDAEGVYFDESIAIVHRRLSIIDLSDAGTQPMVSRSGRYVIAFNGEIYNFLGLKRELERSGKTFKSQTDTEVLLTLFEMKGFECLSDLNGMFAIAVWDRENDELFLARDRLGKKPLYYYSAGDAFGFASELKSLLELPFVSREVRPDAVKDYFFYQYVPDPKTIFNNIHKLSPGCWAKIGKKGLVSSSYWDLEFSENKRSVTDIEEELYELISDSVRLRMISDVPLGAFLSGGVDSSAIVALMAQESKEPVKTCSIGFDSKRYDEVEYAKKVALKFGTDHYEHTVKGDVTDNLVYIAKYFDEPFSDPSFVPTYFVSKLARKNVTVALAGDGGDENFAGYTKYYIDSVENKIRSLVPGFIRKHVLSRLVNAISGYNSSIFRKGESLLSTLALGSDEAFFVTNSFFRRRVWDQLVSGSFERKSSEYDPSEITKRHYNSAPADTHLSRVLYTDIKTYLPGDILVKADRMSMANSLEVRAPLLDYRVVEMAASIPSQLKLNGKETKHILKSTFRKTLDYDTLYRKKMGFSVPLAQWLRHEIYPVAEDCFYSANSGISEVFDMNRVQALWNAHLGGDDQYTHELWNMVAFELWWRQYAPTNIN